MINDINSMVRKSLTMYGDPSYGFTSYNLTTCVCVCVIIALYN
jgi:hypothetical protein